MKFISSTVHGIIDYLVVIFLLASPTLFGFTGVLATFTYILAGFHFLLTILTDYSAGLIKVIPFALHGIIESTVCIIIIVFAYTLFNNNAVGKLFYIIFGTVILYTWLLTNFKEIVTTV
jgi:hypothetical protein